MGREMLHAVEIEAAAGDVYRAITTSEGLASFWTPDSEAASEVGGISRFGFSGAPVDLRMRIESLEPGRRVEWTCVGDFPHWDGTRVSWSIGPRAEGDGVAVLFSHAGWPADQPEAEYAGVNHAWGRILDALKGYVETGEPQPALA
jgi:uncharacterized protein YndB with AHSA1/START domain